MTFLKRGCCFLNEMTRIDRWVDRAKNDMIVAHKLFYDFYPKQLEICCYQCQQAVEKILKVYLLFNNTAFPYTHDLENLCNLCADYNNVFKNFIDDCSDLTPYSTQARYPDSIEINEEEAESALCKAKCILEFCISLIYPEIKDRSEENV